MSPTAKMLKAMRLLQEAANELDIYVEVDEKNIYYAIDFISELRNKVIKERDRKRVRLVDTIQQTW